MSWTSWAHLLGTVALSGTTPISGTTSDIQTSDHVAVPGGGFVDIFFTGHLSADETEVIGSATISAYGTQDGSFPASTFVLDLVGGPSAFSGEIVSGGETVDVGSNLAVSNVTVLSGGNLSVASGGIASATALSNGGFEFVQVGGVEVFGAALSTIINSGGIESVEVNGGTQGAQVNSGGLQVVQTAARADGTVVSGTGAELIVGGTVSGTTLSAGGFDQVFGRALSTTINSGGVDDDLGLTISTTINSGGIQVIDTGGVASGAVVMGGGDELVTASGTARGTTLRGGMEIVYSGGLASGATLSGGMMEVQSGGSVGSSTVTFSGGGTLQLDDSLHFGAGLVAGFGVPDALDLRDIPFIADLTSASFIEAPSNLSGTLSVGDGTPGSTANITLLGQYTAGQFHVTSDGAGGTLVTDPPVAPPTNESPFTLVNTQH